MAINSYSSLILALADWLERDDVATVAETWVGLCEADIARRLRVVDMESAFNVTIASGVAALPSDFLEAKHLYLDGSPTTPLESKSSEWIHTAYPTRGSSDKPQFFAVSAATLIFGPYPDSTYTVKGTYYARPAALSTSNETNFLTSKHPDMLLYGSLMHSAAYLAEDSRADLYATAFMAAVNKANLADKGENFSRHIPLRASPR